MKRKSLKSPSIDAIKHGDKRKNIPTHELRDFVREEEQAPKNMLYPRDPSLDPQLVWKGKDEQDQEELSVPVVPIYIQEKINPQAIVEEVRRDAARLCPPDGVQDAQTAYGGEQPDLFGDFNGLPEDFEQRVDFYHHDANWQNRMILGDSLMVMTSLAEKEGLKGQVHCIYIDPPYGIKFGSNWQVSTRKRDVKDGKAEDATRQPEQVRAFRDTWKLGIHSYLSYLRDRLVVARELLTETGSCFVQIGDENVHLVRCIMDEVFGSENFVSLITLQKSGGLTAESLSSVADYLVWYAKDKQQVKSKKPFRDRNTNSLTENDSIEKDLPISAFQSVALTSSHEYSRGKESYSFNGKMYFPGGRYWSTSPEGMKRLEIADRLLTTTNTLRYKMLFSDFPVMPISNIWNDLMGATDIVYVVQTNTKIIQRCILMSTDPGDLVLDPTCGSGTTAYVAEQWGRRWITIDTSRVALALARTRLMSARYPSYHLAIQYPEWTQFGADESGMKNYLRKHPPAVEKEKADIRKGFVYKRVPHVTLKSIANNPNIKEGMTREEIDAAIAKHADTETLYDQPYEDSRSVRVAGPFTVESLSPHRVISDELSVESKSDAKHSPLATNHSFSDFALMIIENLKKAGVQNTKKNERLKFETLESFPGTWLQAKGTYVERVESGEWGVESGEKKGLETDNQPPATHHTRTVAVSIGPEHGTVGPGQVKEAAKEAVKGLGHDLLIVCGFAFDPHVSEESKRYGALTVLPTKMNPDLAMGDELLKKTGAGNLFMVFGEPDVVVDSEEWIVDSLGRKVVRYGDFKILSGIDSLDEVNGLGCSGLPGDGAISQKRDVRHNASNAKGGGIDSIKHRRGAIEELQRRISAVSGSGAGKPGRTGYADRTVGKAEISEKRGGENAQHSDRGDFKDVERFEALSAIISLSPERLPLTTRHYLTVKLKGVDVYDPTTGAIRSNSTDDIACWFIDTDYNGESFFVRHAYFTGGDEPYDKLKRALRAEINEEAWSSLYSAESRAFEIPEGGRIAIKVINHYGDEVLKVFDVK
jgi:adenine-specific DNA-methyltransferase